MPTTSQITPWTPEDQPLVLQSGPHLDLSVLCDYFKKEYVDKSQFEDDREYNKHLYKMSNLVKRMLHDSSRDERLKTARAILQIEPQCGLAFTVLAREGATSPEDACKYYQNAVGFLRQEHLIRTGDFTPPSDTFEPVGAFIHGEKLVAFVSVECAQWLRGQGALPEAQAVLNKVSQLSADPNDAFISLYCWHIQAGRLKEARALVDSTLSNHARWYYLHAFTLYKESGNTVISRSAMRHACHLDDLIAHALLGDNLFRISRYRIGATEEQCNEATAFAAALQELLYAIPGLRQFLIDSVCKSVPSFAIITELPRQSLSAANLTTPTDAIRFKRWKDNLELVDKCRGHEKLWKKHLKSGIKEAERFPIECWEFYATLRFAAMNRDLSGYSKRDILDMCQRRLDKVDGTRTQRNAAVVYFESACLFDQLMEYEKSEELFAKSISALDSHHILDPCDSDLFLKRLILYKWAHSYTHNSQKVKAAPLFDQVRSLGRSYLGDEEREPTL
ncbi:MAG: hypothetical protein U0105_24745 [Candidatus Obscuribacterales bacterium]